MFDHIHNGTNITYGAFIENILDQYRISKNRRHVTFVHPFLWDEIDKGFSRLQLPSMDLYWLMVLPISDGELKHLKRNGIDSLEDQFERRQIDVFDINRKSAV